MKMPFIVLLAGSCLLAFLLAAFSVSIVWEIYTTIHIERFRIGIAVLPWKI